MKKIFNVLIYSFLCSIIIGQVPNSFKYQAVLRDISGNIKANNTVNLKISILQGSSMGASVYNEIINTSTNAFGMINLEIGSQNPTGFSNINWANGPYFIQINVNDTLISSSQLLAVPFAKYADIAGSVLNNNTYEYDSLVLKGPNGSKYSVKVDSSGQLKTSKIFSLNDGIIAYYPFNGNADDESGNGFNGTDFGTAKYDTTTKGIARFFSNPIANNALDYVTVPNNLKGDYTISMRFLYTSVTHFNTLFYLSSGKDWVHSDLWIALDPLKKLTIIQEGQDLRAADYSHQAITDNPQRLNSIYVNSDSIQPNQYYNFAVTYTNDSLNVYLNGKKYMTYANINPIVPSINTLIIGVCPNYITNLFYYPLEGVIDELRFYKRALNEDEINYLNSFLK